MQASDAPRHVWDRVAVPAAVKIRPLQGVLALLDSMPSIEPRPDQGAIHLSLLWWLLNWRMLGQPPDRMRAQGAFVEALLDCRGHTCKYPTELLRVQLLSVKLSSATQALELQMVHPEAFQDALNPAAHEPVDVVSFLHDQGIVRPRSSVWTRVHVKLEDGLHVALDTLFPVCVRSNLSSEAHVSGYLSVYLDWAQAMGEGAEVLSNIKERIFVEKRGRHGKSASASDSWNVLLRTTLESHLRRSPPGKQSIDTGACNVQTTAEFYAQYPDRMPLGRIREYAMQSTAFSWSYMNPPLTRLLSPSPPPPATAASAVVAAASSSSHLRGARTEPVKLGDSPAFCTSIHSILPREMDSLGCAMEDEHEDD